MTIASSMRVSVSKPQRNVAVDAYRGFVMLLMMAEVLRFSEIARAYPHSLFWRVLAFNQTHVEWTWLSLHDIIQPSFTFLVGVALPYSIRSRQKKGEGFAHGLAHTILRSIVLVALGIFLRSIQQPITYFTFEDTLTQIGLGYPFAFLLTFCKPRWQWIVFVGILFGYWLAWALYPLPPANFDYASVGISQDWHNHLLHGFAAHWNKNVNFGQAFDLWFLNLFPRTSPFVYNRGGYLTLSFIPTLGTMLLGLAAGRWLISSPSQIPLRRFLLAGTCLVASGAVLHILGINPIVKRIWTPAWTLLSGGVCFYVLAAFSWLIDQRGHRRIAFPLVVVGMNSIAAYLIAHLWQDFLESSLHTHLGDRVLSLWGPGLEPFVAGGLILLIYWYALFWMYRNNIFLRI
jgi:heparan-alpha-glucosaminide N-acetyltransferase